MCRGAVSPGYSRENTTTVDAHYGASCCWNHAPGGTIFFISAATSPSSLRQRSGSLHRHVPGAAARDGASSSAASAPSALLSSPRERLASSLRVSATSRPAFQAAAAPLSVVAESGQRALVFLLLLQLTTHTLLRCSSDTACRMAIHSPYSSQTIAELISDNSQIIIGCFIYTTILVHLLDYGHTCLVHASYNSRMFLG